MKRTDDQQTAEIGLPADHVAPQHSDSVSLKRREAMKQIAQKASYIAPATLALFSMQARAS